MYKKYIKIFDFEVGHLIKSPCKDCRRYCIFPRCIAECTLLDKIQDLLSTRPEWASAEWSHGRKTNIAKQLDIPPRPSLLSVESKIGLFRILTVDPTTSTVYFELLEM